MFLIKCFQITLYERFQTRRRSLYIINNTFEPLRCLSGKESTCQCRRLKSCRFNPWVGKIPCGRKRQPTPVFLPGKFHGQRSLEGYSPWGHIELDMTEQAHAHTHTHTHRSIWKTSQRRLLLSLFSHVQLCAIP